MMKPLNIKWPNWLEDIWAKSPDNKKDSSGESLPEHTFNVLKKLSELASIRPHLPKIVKFESIWKCLFWACVLHDFGKATKSFQIVLRGGKRWDHRHEIFSIPFLDWIAENFTGEELAMIGATILFHHKDPEDIFILYPASEESEENFSKIFSSEFDDKTLEGLWLWLQDCLELWIKFLSFETLGIKPLKLPPREEAIEKIKSKGCLIIRNYLRYYRQWFKNSKRIAEDSLLYAKISLRGHIHIADYTASAHIATIKGFHHIIFPDILAALNLNENTAFDHQKRCRNLKSSVILIAPTGSGKTESAIIWAYFQIKNGNPLARIFYTLPYQASMNAMYERLNNGIFSNNVGLEHSRSVLALYRIFLEKNFSYYEAEKQSRALRDLVRLNYYPLKILSPYQIIKAFYRIHAYEEILTDFYNSGFILDEIHAYEPGRLAMILATIEFLNKNFAAKFFVMSATLPDVVLNKLKDVLIEPEAILADPHLYKQFNRHRLFVLNGDLLETINIQRICQDIKRGMSILICLNTVDRAQKAYKKIKDILKDTNTDIILLHGRFNSKDRLSKEKLIRQKTGAKSEKRSPVILVATQVIEVSLDIDLDTIYTDPAPLEALIQRFGRVNRRRLKKEAPVHIFTEPADGHGIYKDELIIRTLNLLKKNHGEMINEEEIKYWLDEIYQGSVLKDWLEAYEISWNQFKATCIDNLRAFDSNYALEEEFYRAFDSIEVLPSNLVEIYLKIFKTEPLEANQLLVSIRWRQFFKNFKSGRAHKIEENGIWVLDCNYDEENGLIFR